MAFRIHVHIFSNACHVVLGGWGVGMGWGGKKARYPMYSVYGRLINILFTVREESAVDVPLYVEESAHVSLCGGVGTGWG